MRSVRIASFNNQLHNLLMAFRPRGHWRNYCTLLCSAGPPHHRCSAPVRLTSLVAATSRGFTPCKG